MSSFPLRTLSTKPSGARLRFCCLVLVLLSLVLAQGLGFMHGIVHAHHADEHSIGRAHAPAHGHAAEEATSCIEALFASHADAGDCRLFDALAQPGHTLPYLALPPVLVPSMGFERLLEGGFVARWAALFDARGPPLSR